ncbi:MAG: ammonium transporter [Acidiferrobacterales bacterium]
MTEPQQFLDVAWLLLCAALVMLMQAGFSCLESGLVRTKNSINVAAKNFADFCVSSAVFWLFGFALMFGVTSGGLFGTSGFFFGDTTNPWLMAFFIFQLGFCGTATTIVSGAVAERMRFAGYLIIATILSALIYPIVGHWVWGSASGVEPGGWLEQRGFIDFAGCTVVHSVGGWISLAAIIIIGPRIGRFGKGSIPIRGHDLPVVTLGVFLLWFGWFGFNGGSTLGLTPDVPTVIVNTTISGAFGGLIAMVLAWRLGGRPDVTMIMNGSLAGLVGITASANIMTPVAAASIGSIAAVVMYGVTMLLEKLEIDDVVGAVPVHLGAGVWGTLAVAIFGDPAIWGSGLGRWDQFVIQVTGVGAGFAWAFGVGFALLWLINRWYPLRIGPDGERVGLNVAEHGSSTEILDLLNEMDDQRRTTDFSQPVSVEPHTEIGQIAQQYNRVLAGINAEQKRREAVTEALKEQSASLQLLRKIAAAANEAGTIEGAMRTCLEDICAFGGWPVGHAYMVAEDDSGELVSTGIWHLDDPERFNAFREITDEHRLGPGPGLAGRTLATGKPTWIADVTQDPSFRRAKPAKDIGVKAGFAFPVLVGEDVVAVLEFFATEVVEPDEAVLEIMASVGTQLGRVVERGRSEAARFKTVLDHIPAMVYLRDLDGRFALINRKYEEIHGVTNDGVRGKKLQEVFRKDEAEEYAELDAEVIRKGQILQREETIALRGKTGNRSFAVVKFPVFDLAGEIVALGGIDIDITDRKQHEAELAGMVRKVETARDQAMQATQAKSQFLANMSHELRTPMNAIIGFTRLVMRRGKDVLPKKQNENLEKILVSADHLLSLINDILDISKIEAGQIEVHPVELSLEPLVDLCLRTVEPLIKSKRVRLVKEVEATLPVLFTDEDKLRQILLNLLSNAVKFTEKGTITVTGNCDHGAIAIAVSDTGIGIPKDALDKIFDEFHQVDSSSTREYAGTGLGLAITRHLAHVLGGDITVQSSVQVGSTFTVTIPQRYVAAA